MGRMLPSFRTGNLAEGTCVEIFRRFAAMATVPRADDIGVDAVGNLLRLHDGMLYAEDQFYLQVKSAGVKVFPYLDWTPEGRKKEVREYTWLRAQRLPMFLASVDMKANVVEVYSMHFARFALNKHVATGVIAYIGDAKPPNHVPENWPINGSGKPEPTPDTWETVSLGKPALRFTFAEAQQDGFADRVFPVLKGWCRIENRFLAVDHATNVRPTAFEWEANEPPNELGGMMAVMGPGDTLAADLGDAAAVLASHLIAHSLKAQIETMSVTSPESLRVTAVMDYFRERGVPMVPLGSVARVEGNGQVSQVATSSSVMPLSPDFPDRATVLADLDDAGEE